MISEQIETYRTTKCYDVNYLCERMGIKNSAYYKIRNGKTEPSSETIEKLVRNTDINAHWLTTGEGPMTRPVNPESRDQVNEHRSGYVSADEITEEEQNLITMMIFILRGKWEGGYEASLKQNIKSFYHAAKSENNTRVLESNDLKPLSHNHLKEGGRIKG